MIAEYEALLGANVEDRVLGLFGLFRNEMIELGEKRRQLPHFTEFIRSGGAAPDGDTRKIIARGHGRCWVCKIVKERATEHEVLELVEGSGKSRETASQTRVLVALSGMDDNAKLLAKEKKVLTLGLSRINLLMDIYGRSPIIHTAPNAPDGCARVA